MLKTFTSLLPDIMEKIPAKKILLSLSFTAAISTAYAQNDNGGDKYLGSVSEFKDQIIPSAKKRKSTQTLLPLSENKKLGVNVHYDKKSGASSIIAGKAKENGKTRFNLTITEEGVAGQVLFLEEKKALEYYTKDDKVFSKDVDINKLICIGTPAPSETGTQTSSQVAPPGSYVYTLQSHPSSEFVVYLDFDGQYVVDPYWNGGLPINALPSELNETEIEGAWRLISEDYRPFDLNITTDSTIFNAAPSNKRMKVIFTPTSDAAPGWGGVAQIGSFPWTIDTPCWVFLGSTKYAGEAGSHEIGHTVGLYHDGTSDPYDQYYGGQGYWAPIMGVGYYKELTQFSKGEYNNANNSYQDDINVIATTNGFSFREDADENKLSKATQLIYNNLGDLSSTGNNGIIINRTDVDYFYFNTLGGSVTLAANPDPYYPDLDISLTLKNAAGNIIEASDPEGLNAFIDTIIPAGTYYVIVDGVGYGDPATDGYSDYGSLGYYSLLGHISNSVSNAIPTVTITAPLEGADILLGTPITISAAASDAEGPIAKVDFYDGTTFIGSDNSTPFSFTYNGATAGTHVFKAVAFDSQGLTNQTSVTVLVAGPNQLPVVTVTYPTNGAVLDPTYVVQATANAFDNDGTITAVYFYKDNVIVGVDYTAPYTTYIDIFSAGTYNIKAEAVDNRNGHSFSATNTFSVNAFGFSGPTCAIKGIPYNFHVVPEYPNPVYVSAWTNTDATVSFNYYNREYFDVTFGQYAASSVVVTVQLSYTAYPYNVQYSKTVTTNGCGSRAAIIAFPSSDGNQTVISLDSKEKITSYQIIDLTGREVASGQNQDISEIAVGENLKSGMYLINFAAESGNYTHKIVK